MAWAMPLPLPPPTLAQWNHIFTTLETEPKGALRAAHKWLLEPEQGHTMSYSKFEKFLRIERENRKLWKEALEAAWRQPRTAVPLVDAWPDAPPRASLVEEDATVPPEAHHATAPPERTEHVAMAAANPAPAEDAWMHAESLTPPGSLCGTSADSPRASVVHGEVAQAAEAPAPAARFHAADLASSVEDATGPPCHLEPVSAPTAEEHTEPTPAPCKACVDLLRGARTTAHFAVADDLPPVVTLQAVLGSLSFVCKDCYKAREKRMHQRTSRWCTLVLRYDHRGEPVAALLRAACRPEARSRAWQVGESAEAKHNSSQSPNVVQGGRWQAQPDRAGAFKNAFDAMEVEQRPYQVSASMHCLPYMRRTRFAPRSLAGAAVRFAPQVDIRRRNCGPAELASSRSRWREWPGEGTVAALGPVRRP